MAAVQLLLHRGSKTNLFHKLCCVSQRWNAAKYAIQCSGADDNSKHGTRQYSGLAMHRTKLQLRKLQCSPLYIANSKRNFEYNVFLLFVEVLQYQFIYAKNMFGLDWCATIFLCTMPYRVGLAYALKKKSVEDKYKAKDIFENQLAKLEKKEKKKIRSDINMRLSERERKKMFRNAMNAHRKRIYKEENYNPYHVLIYSFAPLPFWIANSWALRHLSGGIVPFLTDVGSLCPDMQTGGMLWFPNLCEADPYHILPILTCFSFLMAIELNSLTNRNYGRKKLSVTRMEKIVTGLEYALRAWCLIAMYIFWNLPAAMTWYWGISGFIALTARLCLIHPEVERRLVPPNHHLHIDEHPYKTILTNMEKRYNPKNWFIS